MICYSGWFDESNEKLKVAFCYFSVTKSIVALSSSNIYMKLTFWGLLVLVWLHKSIPISL